MNLTPQEKKIMNIYISKETRTQNMHLEYGAKNDLVRHHIIYRSSDVGRQNTGFSFDIQPWAWEYLKKHEELLDTPIDKINW